MHSGSNGWWQGVVTGVGISGIWMHCLLVLIVHREDIRACKDWVRNKLFDVIANPNIRSYVSANVNPILKIYSTCSRQASGCGSRALLEHKILTTSKLETVREDEQELALPRVSKSIGWIWIQSHSIQLNSILFKF
ncbi:hypothetical protein ACOSQ3_009714 [Xanthoceras sorbifolium]